MNEPTNQESNKKIRAAVYIDGFNLYHPVHEIGEPHLKWCNLWELSNMMCLPINAELVGVTFCTAVPSHMPDKRDRHNTFNNAQQASGVKVVKGHHVFDDENQKHSEKQSDINLALAVILDGLDDLYDVAYLLSADSDQASTARHFSERLPNKKLIGVAPPNRKVPKKSLPYLSAYFTLTRDNIEECIMPAFVQGGSGLIRRPAEYDPPHEWVHPKHRPKKK